MILYITKQKPLDICLISYTRSKLALRLMGLKGIVEKEVDFDERMSANK